MPKIIEANFKGIYITILTIVRTIVNIFVLLYTATFLASPFVLYIFGVIQLFTHQGVFLGLVGIFLWPITIIWIFLDLPLLLKVLYISGFLMILPGNAALNKIDRLLAEVRQEAKGKDKC